MGIIKTLKEQGSELSKYDGKTPRDTKPEKLNRILRFQGSELSKYDGRTPREARYPDPLDSSDSYLSAYKGLTPQPNLLTTNQSPLLYPYSITGEARDQVQFEYGLYSNGATAVLPLPTLLGVNIFDTPLSYYYDGTEGYYAKTVGVGTNPSRQTLSDGTLENRLTIAYTAKIANQELGSLAINPFGVDTTTPPNILLQYNTPVSSPEEPSLEFVRIQNPTIRLEDLYDNGKAQAKAIFDNPNRTSPLPGQKFDSHKEPVWVYNPTRVGGGASSQYGDYSYENGISIYQTLFTNDYRSNILNRNNNTIYNKPFNNPKATISYISNDPSKLGYLTPNIVDSANVVWVYNPLKDSIEGIADSSVILYGKAIGQEAYVEVQAYGGGVNTFPDNFLKLNQNNTNVAGFAKELQALEDTKEIARIEGQLNSTNLNYLNPIYTSRISSTGDQIKAQFGTGENSNPLSKPYPAISLFNRTKTYKTTDAALAKYGAQKSGSVIFRQTNQSFNVDKLNALPPVTSSFKQVGDEEFGFKEFYEEQDLIKFYFEIINNNAVSGGLNNAFLYFRAYINNLGDNFNSEWQPYKYVGRGENFYKYSGFSREISLDFTIYAHSRAEMLPLYRKLNLLAGTTAPDYSELGYMRGNFIKLTVGDYIISTPGIIKSINLKPSLEAGWDINRYAPEISDNGYGKLADDPSLENTGGVLIENQEYKGSNYSVGQLPRLIDVTLTFTPIHSFTPQFGQNFIRNYNTGTINFT